MATNIYQRSARLHYLTRQQARIRQEVKAALPRVKIGQLCYVWHDSEYQVGRIVRISASRKHPGTWNTRIYPFAHRVKHQPPWSVCQLAHMVRTDPPEWECIECGREFYRHEMAETDICAECAQGAGMAEIETIDSAATFWADWLEDDQRRGCNNGRQLRWPQLHHFWRCEPCPAPARPDCGRFLMYTI